MLVRLAWKEGMLARLAWKGGTLARLAWGRVRRMQARPPIPTCERSVSSAGTSCSMRSARRGWCSSRPCAAGGWASSLLCCLISCGCCWPVVLTLGVCSPLMLKPLKLRRLKLRGRWGGRGETCSMMSAGLEPLPPPAPLLLPSW